MTQSEKRFLTIISITLIILTCVILARNLLQVSKSHPNEEITVGYHCTTDNSELSLTKNGDFIASSITFTHSVSTAEGNKLTDLTVAVNGSVSPAESSITHISAQLSDQQWDGLTVSELTTADTATVILFQDQLSICHFQYRIFPDGRIKFLQ